MLTRELVESLYEIKDGEFYHKPKLEIDDLYLKYKDKVDPRVWDAIRSDIWCA